MIMLKKLIFLTLALIFLSYAAEAVPIISNPVPQNDSYVYGRQTDIFSVNVSDDLNISSITLYARVEDPTSIWASVNMNCSLYSPVNCSCNSIPNIDALGHDGNWLIYYFDAYDTGGGYGNLGDSTDPLRVRIDRSPPNVTFVSPENESFSSGNFTISLDVNDVYSHVNSSTVNYSFDNSTWLSMSTVDNRTFSSVEKWNTKTYDNNQSVNIYARATDVLGNEIYIKARTIIDNELPKVFRVEPQSNQILYGDVALELRAEDAYSGLSLSSISYSIQNSDGTFTCLNNTHSTNCTATFSTNSKSDGRHQLDFRAKDKAKNEITNSTFVTIDNLPPKITIISPSASSIVSGKVNVSASVKDDGIGVANVSLRIESSGSSSSWENMSCIADYCSYIWDSSGFVDGTYTIRIYSIDKLERESSMVLQVGVSNTQNQGNGGGRTSIASTVPIGASATTTTTQTQSGQSISQTILQFVVDIPKIIISKKENIFTLVLILVLIPVSIFSYFISKRKQNLKVSAPKSNISDEYMENLRKIEDAISNPLLISNIDNLKDKVRLAIFYLKDVKRDFVRIEMQKALASARSQAEINNITKFFNEKDGEVKNIQEIKGEYLDEISKSLNDILKEEDIKQAQKNLENIVRLVAKLKNLIAREKSILSEGLGGRIV